MNEIRMKLKPPVGLYGIIDTFGDIQKFIQDDGVITREEEDTFLVRTPLPQPMIYAYDETIRIKNMVCHKLMADIFTQVFTMLSEANLAGYTLEYGGCYVFRSKRTGSKLSTHSWGISVDLNPRTNKLGTKGDMSPIVVDIFKSFGFTWGGDWKLKDSMHFQYCSGY